MNESKVSFGGLTPYLHYDDIVAMIDWLTNNFGFVEKMRWLNEHGQVTNAELSVGDTEVWLDGDPDGWKKRGRRPEEWIGVWVTSADAICERLKSKGLNPRAPENKFYGVRMIQIGDPEGYAWGFMERAPYRARHPD